MKVSIHQTHHTIGDFESIYNYIDENIFKGSKSGIHIFPELFLTGYPLQDLCLQKQFIDNYQNFLAKIEKTNLKQEESEKLVLFGGLDYHFDQAHFPDQIRNVIFALTPGKKLESVYTKILLPNYDIFDEKKYFTPGEEVKIFEFAEKKLGLMICEDMWPSSTHPTDPVKSLKDLTNETETQLDAIINLSASPFYLGKHSTRHNRAKEISHLFKAPFFYVNKVGSEDEIIFDGASFVVNGDDIALQCKSFSSEIQSVSLPKYQDSENQKEGSTVTQNTWESLFTANLVESSSLPTISPLTDQEAQVILGALQLGIQDYAKKCGFNKFIVALSGGIDSSLVLTIMRLILQSGQSLEAVFMPGLFTQAKSFDLSYQLAKNLEVPIKTLPIKFFHSAVRNAYKDVYNAPMEGLVDENIQSRLRGSLLYARSNDLNAMVLNTSNKSEIAVGYSTLYGDSVGAISVLGDLYKSEVFQLAEYINQKYGSLMPEEIITRPPSAELRENQEDQQSLPPYDILDPILEGFLCYRHSIDDLIKLGFQEETVKKVHGLITRAEYKRSQFCPIIKLKDKSFGFGYRNPICKKI